MIFLLKHLGKYNYVIKFLRFLSQTTNTDLNQEDLGAWWNFMNPSICRIKDLPLKIPSVHTVKEKSSLTNNL